MKRVKAKEKAKVREIKESPLPNQNQSRSHIPGDDESAPAGSWVDDVGNQTDVPCVLFTVANKVAFMEAGAVPAMMRLMDRGPDDPITAIALDAVTILAEDNDEVDEAVALLP